VLSTLDNFQPGIGRIPKELDFLSSVGDRINNIASSLLSMVSCEAYPGEPLRDEHQQRRRGFKREIGPSTHMQPQNWTQHIIQAHVQSISIPQIDRTHPDPPPSLIALVILLNLVNPKGTDVFGTFLLPKAHVDEEVAEIRAGHKVWRRLVGSGAELAGDAVSERVHGVPAA
jgi:hypothetical protein